MACFELIIWKNRIERVFQVKDGENFKEKEGTTNDISLFLDLINVKDSHNFCTSTCRCFETLIVCPWLFVAIQLY